jgi:hypothetical protein
VNENGEKERREEGQEMGMKSGGRESRKGKWLGRKENQGMVAGQYLHKLFFFRFSLLPTSLSL